MKLTFIAAKEEFVKGNFDKAWSIARQDDGLERSVTKSQWLLYMVGNEVLKEETPFKVHLQTIVDQYRDGDKDGAFGQLVNSNKFTFSSTKEKFNKLMDAILSPDENLQMIYKHPDPERTGETVLARHHGQTCVVGRTLTEFECDAECLMKKVVFSDGFETDVFFDELTDPTTGMSLSEIHTPPELRVDEYAKKHKDELIGKLIVEGATDLSEETLNSVFEKVVMPEACIRATKALVHAGEITMDDLAPPENKSDLSPSM